MKNEQKKEDFAVLSVNDSRLTPLCIKETDRSYRLISTIFYIIYHFPHNVSFIHVKNI